MVRDNRAFIVSSDNVDKFLNTTRPNSTDAINRIEQRSRKSDDSKAEFTFDIFWEQLRLENPKLVTKIERQVDRKLRFLKFIQPIITKVHRILGIRE